MALLFITWAKPGRLRVHGRARIAVDDPLLASMPGAQLVVHLEVTRLFPNCPRYIHTMRQVARSPYVPDEGVTPPRPGWKDSPSFADALPARDRDPGKASR